VIWYGPVRERFQPGGVVGVVIGWRRSVDRAIASLRTDGGQPATADAASGFGFLASTAGFAASERIHRSYRAAALAIRLRRGYIARLVLLVALYYGAAHVGYALGFAGPVAAILWLPVGVGVAFLYLEGPRFWPGVLIGDLLANNYSALPVGSAIGQTFGNLLEVLVAALLLRRLVRRGSPLDGVGGLARMLLAIATGTAVSATVGCVSLWLGDVISTKAMPSVWRTWWLGDSSGALIVVPLALASVRPLRRDWNRRRALEAVVLIAALSGLNELAMHQGSRLTYVVFPALIWAALRFGQRGATVAVAITTAFTVWGTSHYMGAFVSHSLSRSDLSTQLYIAVAALSTFCLAALVSEREGFAKRLTASRARLVVAADTERRRLERNLHDGVQGRLAALLVRLAVESEQVHTHPDEAGPALLEAQSQVSQAIEELRELAHGIQPRLLTDFGLAKAVESLAQHSQIPIDVLERPVARFDVATEATAYYVLAEALTNAQKHAHASSIRVRARAKAGFLQIEVIDDGIGGADERGFGLEGLRDRVEASGGRFEIDSRPGRGTRIAAQIPGAAVSPQPPP
jgi:signal transduction histidine kinase